jgi:ABC-type lipoprotein release transport system permease subunit
MSTALVGALVGLAIGLAAFLSISAVAARVEREDTKKVLRVAGLVDLVLFPVAGWFLAPMLMG